MTAEELLAAMAEQEPLVEDGTYCTIDPETRIITIPPEYQLLGVESDEKAERLYFQCPKIVGDNIDLSTLGLRINFQNANMQKDQYIVDDVQVSGDMITFSWLLSRRVTQYRGDVSFIVCAVKISGEAITNEWNTTLATAQVLEGLEVETELPEEETDVVNQLIAIATQRLTDVQNATSAANTAASNANQKAQEAENAAEDARGVTDQITKDSYLHTALQSFIDTVTATPTAYGNAVVKKIEGFTRQEVTTGAQLFDVNNLIAYNEASFSVMDNGRSIKVTGKMTEEGQGSSVICVASETILNLLKGKSIHIYVDHNASLGWFEIGFNSISSGWTYRQLSNKQWTTINIPSDVKQVNFSMIPNRQTETDVTVLFNDIKIGLTQFETWEPYTGGQPAPNPDYPMEVQGNGKYGFWDGEFENGAYNSVTGKPESGTNYIRCLNDITYPLKSGDEIKFTYEKPVNIGILLFDKQGALTYASSSKSAEWEYTVTKDQERFRFFVLDTDGVNTETAKHLTITINGKYALCVKSEGVNLCAYVESGAYLHSNGKPSSTENYVRTNKMIVKPNTVYKESSVIEGTVTKTAVFWDENQTFIKYSSFDSDIQTPSNCKYIALNYNADGLTVSKVRNVMITEKSVFPNTYVPYQSNVTYIPVDYPLFEGDKIIQRNGEYKLVRYHGIEIADGTTDWNKNTPSDPNDYAYYRSEEPLKAATKAIYCDRLRKVPNAEKTVGISMSIYYPRAIYVRLDADLLPTNDAEHFKQWLSENPLTIIYPLDTPTEEPLSPEAQKALHSIMAADEQTELTIVGVPADAGIQNQFLLPRNEDGALNTTAYCTGVKNKLTLDELLAQNLDSRVNKLEIDNAALAEQTIVVE